MLVGQSGSAWCAEIRPREPLLADKLSMWGANCESPLTQLGELFIGHWLCQRSAGRKKMSVIMTIRYDCAARVLLLVPLSADFRKLAFFWQAHLLFSVPEPF